MSPLVGTIPRASGQGAITDKIRSDAEVADAVLQFPRSGRAGKSVVKPAAARARATDRSPHGVPRTRGCDDPILRARLLPYILMRAGDDEAADFEAHVLLCGTCFGDLKALFRARELVAELSLLEARHASKS